MQPRDQKRLPNSWRWSTGFTANASVAVSGLGDLGWELEHLDEGGVGVWVETVFVDEGHHDGGGGVGNAGIDCSEDGGLGGSDVDGCGPGQNVLVDFVDVPDCVPAVC